MACLYTSEELITKIKLMDSKLDDAVTQSRLNTSQTDHQISMSTRAYREQREVYKALLQRNYPSTYLEYFGSSIIQVRGHHGA